ncbi:MAG TPA: TonB-dependent receptor [Chitinophagaceae bacterium]
MKKLMSAFLLLSSFLYSIAQPHEIRGRITDNQNGNGVPGATVAIKGSSISTVSDNKGYYKCTVYKAGDIVLIISHVGYQTTELNVSVADGGNTVNVALVLGYQTGDEIVVSVSKRPEKITVAPASIQVIGKKELEQFTGSNVYVLLSKVQSIEFTRTSVDHASFNARGLNNAFNGKVFQMIDGRNSMTPLSANLMMHNNYSLVKDDIERVEVVLGPQTALYGPNAHNAMINFITKDPRTSQGTTVSLSAGNRYQFSGRFRHATKINDKWAYKLSGEYSTGKDFEFYDSVYAGNQTGSTPFFGPPVAIPERNINFNFRHIRGEAHVYFSAIPKTDIILSTGGSNNNSINTHTNGHLQFRDMTNNFLQGRLVHPRFFITVYNTWADIGSSFNIGAHTMDYWNRTHSTLTSGPNRRLSPDSAEINAMRYGIRVKEKSQRFNAEAQYNYKIQQAGLFLVTGFSYQKDKPHAFGISLVDSFQRINITQLGAVLQLEKELPWNLRFVGAVRWDNHSNFGNFIAPKLGLVKRIADGSIRITWARAYSMPSVFFQYGNLNDLFYGNGEGVKYIPNFSRFSDPASVKTITPLKPEEINTWEFGYKGNITGKLYVDINYYNGLSKNFFSPSITVGGRALSIGNRPLHHNPAFAGQVINDTLRNARFLTVFNFGDVRVYGFDAGLTYTFNKILNLAVKYSWIGSDIKKGKMENDANKDGFVMADEKSLNSANHRGLAILSFQNLLKQKMTANISVRYVAEFDFYSGNQIGTKAGAGKRGEVRDGNGGPVYIKNFDWGPLGGFTTVDLGAGYKFNELLSAGINVSNLFNTKQLEFVGSPSIGRLIMLELKVNIDNFNK